MDLADRLSRGAVAALDLAPLDRRFADLSRQVITGGASRFATVVAPGEPVTHVIPVGVPEGSVAFGALVLQPSQAGLVWRDTHDAERTAVVALRNATRATWAPLVLGGEEWTRVDLDDRATRAAFLLPPTQTPTLRQAVVALLGATAGASTAGVPTPTPNETSVDDRTVVRSALPDRDTVTLTPVSPPAADAGWPGASDVGVTRQRPAAPPPSPGNAWRTPQPPVDAWAPEDTPLYRDAPRPPAMPSAPPVPAVPGYQSAGLWQQHDAPLSTPAAASPAPGVSRTLVGFLAGLLGTLVVGGIALALLFR